jgi:hypothetical protein
VARFESRLVNVYSEAGKCPKTLIRHDASDVREEDVRQTMDDGGNSTPEQALPLLHRGYQLGMLNGRFG